MAWTPPPVLKNPNILIVMVDEICPPMWLNASQPAALSQIRPSCRTSWDEFKSNSYNFEQFFVAATSCRASRSALLTGLYAPQTAMYVLAEEGAPARNPAFPTWGEALTTLNPAYQGSVWWFGKWHLSDRLSASPLLPYGFTPAWKRMAGGCHLNRPIQELVQRAQFDIAHLETGYMEGPRPMISLMKAARAVPSGN